MSSDRPAEDAFDLADAIQSDQVWYYQSGSSHRCPDVAATTAKALSRPDDFPPIGAAIVANDHVVLAVDPNVPDVALVVRGVVAALSHTDAGQMDVVVGDEATDATMEAIRSELAPTSKVVRHASSDRRQLGYLNADADGEPIYLSRMLVEADFVLPIVTLRLSEGGSSTGQRERSDDITGIYPALADSAARSRVREAASMAPASHADGLSGSSSSSTNASPSTSGAETTWLLGVQLMIGVTADAQGRVGEVHAGTIEAIKKRMDAQFADRAGDDRENDFPPPAPLVIATLDGDDQSQTWAAAARAAVAASRVTEPGGTIVLWTQIQTPPSGRLLAVADMTDHDLGGHDSRDADSSYEDSPSAGSNGEASRETDDDFPVWDDTLGVARRLANVASEYRLLIHSRLEAEDIESMGLGVVQDRESLAHLSRPLDGCGVMRAAQYS